MGRAESVLPALQGGRVDRGTTTSGRRKASSGRFRPALPWRDLRSTFGAYQSSWERHQRWPTDGTYGKLFAAVRANAPDQFRKLLRG